MAEPTPKTHVKKRIVLCCDGTWMNSDGDIQAPSNVTRISRSIKQEGVDKTTGKPIPQVIYYQSGVGTEDSWFSAYVGGATGRGLAEHIREAYSFVCHNYYDGDEIFIIGFSRGAFTARSIASLISAIGLLTPAGLAYFYQIFEDWEYQLKAKDGWVTRFPSEPWPHRPPIDNPEYVKKLVDLKFTQPHIKIKAVAVWDTVGALGIPMIGILPQPPSKDFSFVNTKVDSNVEYAFQALALDEHRRSYSPSIWEKPANQAWPRILKQTWFPGVHSDVGGSYNNADLANLTLAWMISQLDPLLDFDHKYVVRLNELSMEREAKKDHVPREWGLGKIHDSMTPFFRIGGSKIRTPCEYTATDPDTFKPLPRRLENTNEHVHSSVRIRMGRGGRGYGDKPGTRYASEALQGWTMDGTERGANSLPTPLSPTTPDGGITAQRKMKNVRWVKTLKKGTLGNDRDETLEMLEDELGDLENTILQAWPALFKEFESIRPGADHPTKVKKGSITTNATGSTSSSSGSGQQQAPTLTQNPTPRADGLGSAE